MTLSHFFIDRPRFATVINVFIVLVGLAMLTTLPVAQYPNIVPPTVQITASYPGASGETVARTVATPLEQAVNGVENMDYITSQSTGNGLLTITVIFKVGTDPNTALMLTRNRVQDTLTRLPQEVQLQGVQVKKTIPALLLGVHPYSPDDSRSAEYISNYMILHIKDEIARLPGVADLWALGERQYAMRIWVDPDKAAASNISANEILAALRAQNAQVSAGVLNQPPTSHRFAYQISVEALGRLTTPKQFGDVVVKADAEGRVTRIRDIARVELGATDYGSKAYADHRDSAPFWVIAQPGANVVQVEHAGLVDPQPDVGREPGDRVVARGRAEFAAGDQLLPPPGEQPLDLGFSWRDAQLRFDRGPRPVHLVQRALDHVAGQVMDLNLVPEFQKLEVDGERGRPSGARRGLRVA